MNVATQLFQKAFHSTRDARSEAYKAGVLETFEFKESGSELKHPFEPGTAESDAWFAGNQEAHNIWICHNEQEGQEIKVERCDLGTEKTSHTYGVSRKHASLINPLIDDTTSSETLSRVRDMVFLLQDINAQGLDIECEESNRAVFHTLNFIQGAIDFEIGNSKGNRNGK